MLVIVIWVGVVFASIVCTAAYFGGLGGAILKRWFSRTLVASEGRTATVTPVEALQLSKPATVEPDVEKGGIDISNNTILSTEDKKVIIVVT